MEVIEEEAGCELEFDHFPKEEAFIIKLREKINFMIKERIYKQGKDYELS